MPALKAGISISVHGFIPPYPVLFSPADCHHSLRLALSGYLGLFFMYWPIVQEWADQPTGYI